VTRAPSCSATLNKVDPADLVDDVTTERQPSAPDLPGGPDAPDAPESPGTPSSPDGPDSAAQQNATDEEIVASIDAAVADAQGIARVLTDNNESIVSVDSIDYDAPTSTVQVAVTTDVTDPGLRDSVAFYVTDIMAFLWAANEPSRQADATIRPRLEVAVDEVLYGTPFDVMTAVADYTITQAEWLKIVTGGGAFLPALKQNVKIGGKTDGDKLLTTVALA
jgi:hypothetical protein